jgi:preprotein translocase subunit SecG
MYILVLLIHVVVCLFLIVVILLQSGKAADLAGAFGGMGSQTAFGPRGSATLLSKATTASAAIFMVTSLTLSILATRNAGLATTVLEDQPVKSIPVKTMPVTQPQSPGKTVTIPLPPRDQNNTKGPVPLVPAPAKK